MKVKKLFSMFMVLCILLSITVYAHVAAGISRTSEAPIVGAPSQKMWTFKAVKSGTYKIEFNYSRPWEKDTPALETVVYTVKVTKKSGLKSEALALSADTVNNVKRNQKFTVTLEENTSTGYSWSYKTNNKAIKLVKEENLETKDAVIVGASTQKTWTFEANKSGNYTIEFTYSQPWDASSKADTAIYTIKVTDDNSTASAPVALTADAVNNVKIGQDFTVTLEENISTGYSWNYILNEDVIKLIK